MHVLVGVLLGLAVGVPVGAVWGRKLQQKAVGVALYELQRGEDKARVFVNHMEEKFPWLAKHLHL
jgi:phage gp46-like protein